MSVKKTKPRKQKTDESGPSTQKSSKALIAGINRTYGAGSVRVGDTIERSIPRMICGVWPVTLATGGGYPLWQMSRLMGPESGGKSGLTLSAIAVAGRLCWRCMNIAKYCTCDEEPFLQKTLVINSEGIHERAWSEAVGAIPNTYFEVDTFDGNTCCDLALDFLNTTDGGLVIIDSLANLVPASSHERSVGDAQIGVHAKMLRDLADKMISMKRNQRLINHPCLVLCTNQLRYKIGTLYGNPETECGGQSLKHWVTLGLRVSKLSDTPASRKFNTKDAIVRCQHHGFSINKNRVWVYAKSGDFYRFLVDVHDAEKTPPRLNYAKGSTFDHDLLLNSCIGFGVAEYQEAKVSIPNKDIYGQSKASVVKMLKSDMDLYFQLQIECARALTHSVLGGSE